MDVSENSGTPKMIIFSRKTHGFVGETHHFRTPPKKNLFLWAKRQAWSQNTGPGGPTAEERAVAQELGNGLLQLGSAMIGGKGVADGNDDPIFLWMMKRKDHM